MVTFNLQVRSITRITVAFVLFSSVLSLYNLTFMFTYIIFIYDDTDSKRKRECHIIKRERYIKKKGKSRLVY